jgi:hypothetical protein
MSTVTGAIERRWALDRALDCRIKRNTRKSDLNQDAILSKTFNQSCNEIYEVETTFLSKIQGVFVSSLRIIMAYVKGEAQEKHGKFTRQSGVWGFHNKHQGMSMIKSVAFIMGCGLVVILRNGEWNELIGHPKDCGKDSPNSKANSLQPGEDDVDWTYRHSNALV